MGRTYLRSAEVAKLLGCSKQYVVRLIAEGKLESHRLSRTGWHRISLRSLRQYAASRGIHLELDAINGYDNPGQLS